MRSEKSHKSTFLFSRFLSSWLFLSTLIGASKPCDFRCKIDDEEWKKLGTTRRCSALNFVLHQAEVEERIHNIRAEGNFELLSVAEIEVSNQEFPLVLFGWKNFFSENVSGLKMSNVGLPRVSALSFKAFPNLIFLDLGGNLIDSLPRDLFTFTSHIEFQEVKGNRIRTIGPEAHSRLTKLKEIDFPKNLCIDAKASNFKEVLAMIESFERKCSYDGVGMMSWPTMEQHELQVMYGLIFVVVSLMVYLLFELASKLIERIVMNRESEQRITVMTQS